MTLGLDGQPSWVNYNTLYSLAKGVRSYFAQDVISAVHIGIEADPTLGTIEPTLDALATEGRIRSPRNIGGERIPIQEAGLAGIAFLRDHDLNAHQFRFVGE